MGKVRVTPDTERAIEEYMEVIRPIRNRLIRRLGARKFREYQEELARRIKNSSVNESIY